MMTKNLVLISLEKVNLVRGSKKVLMDISWTIKEGEHWFLMGKNGSGKTSLLEVISGYLWASEGKVEVLGEAYGNVFLPDLRKKFGYVAPWILKRTADNFSVREVIASGTTASVGYDKRISKNLSRHIRSLLRFLECSAIERIEFGRLSSGEQLKTLLARALIANPKILILDEPFSHLDLGIRIHLYQLLEKLGRKKNGPSLILATHHIEDIGKIFTHGLLLKEGRIFKTGIKREILTKRLISDAFDVIGYRTWSQKA